MSRAAREATATWQRVAKAVLHPLGYEGKHFQRVVLCGPLVKAVTFAPGPHNAGEDYEFDLRLNVGCVGVGQLSASRWIDHIGTTLTSLTREAPYAMSEAALQAALAAALPASTERWSDMTALLDDLLWADDSQWDDTPLNPLHSPPDRYALAAKYSHAVGDRRRREQALGLFAASTDADNVSRLDVELRDQPFGSAVHN